MCLIDDVLVHGTTQEEHDKNLLAVLSRIQDTSLTLNKDKCEFNKSSIKWLGQVVDPIGIKPNPDKIRAITSMPQPTILQQLRRFLGIVNQLTKFFPNFAN